MKLNFRRLLAMFLSIVMVAGMLPAAVFAEDAVVETTPNEGYMLTIYNADGTVGMEIDGSKSVSDFSLKSAIEDARTFVNNAFLFGITTPATFVVEMYEDSTEDESFEIGSDVTIKGNGNVIQVTAADAAISGSATLIDTGINAYDADALTVSGLTFEGNSWINSGTAETLTVSGVTANVTPSNTTYTNSRSAFISLGRSEQKLLELVVENSNIVADGGADPILGWAAITKATITGNTFGSAAAYQTNSDSVKFMAIADGATLNFEGNTVYSNYNGIVLGQNTTRGNAYTATFTNNTFIGGADHIWIEVSGSNTCNGNVNAKSDNTINGNIFTVNDIKVHPYLNTYTGYMGVDVELDAEGKVIGGTLASSSNDEVIAEGYELDENRKVVQSAPAVTYVAKIGEEKFETVAAALAYAKEQGMTDVEITLIGETETNTTDSFNLLYTTLFNSVTFKQEDPTKTYYLCDLYTGVRTNDGKFIFDGVNITVTDQYMFQGNVELINNSKITSTAEANCFFYYADVIVNGGSFIKGVIEDIRGGTLTIDGGKTDGTYAETPSLQDAIFIVNWADSNLVLQNGAYVKINAANEVGRLTVNGTLNISDSKLDSYQWIAVNAGATLTVNGNSTITTKEITGAGKLVIDATNMTAGAVATIDANASGFTGTIEVVNSNLGAEIVDGKIVLVEKVIYVAEINGTKYETLDAAFAAAQAGDTIVLLTDAAPALPSQRAITKAAVIDLGGKTLTLTEDDLYFGTTTFKNGTIVVDPSVYASTAVFWIFENQTLIFDNVEIIATGVTGTYLIGINGGNGSAVKLINGSKITIANTNQAGLTAVICDNGTGNNVVISDSTINVASIEGRLYLGGTNGKITVKNSTVTANGVKEGFYLRAGQTLAIEGTSFVSVTLNSDDGRYGINVTDATATYTKADTATVNATDNVTPAAPAGTLTNCYTSGTGYWGECGGNAKESFVFKFYNNDTYMGYTSLNNVGEIIDGDVYVSWSIKLDADSNTDKYWSMAWEIQPTLAMQPNRCEQWVDGVKVAEATVEPNWSDRIFPVVAAVVDNSGVILSYVNGTEGYTLADAINAGGNIVLLRDVTLTEALTVPAGKPVVLDLNGYKVVYNSTTQGEAMITNKGTLTINDTVGGGVINYNYTGAADPSYSKGNYTISNGGTLTVNGGKITIANLRTHAKYPIDNNSTTGDAILVINGGHLYNYNTSAIRQFCNSTTNKNSVTINGGVIEGYCAIWVQNPGKNTVNGRLSITGGEIRTTASAYVNGTSELKDVASRIYCTIDGEGGAWSVASSVSITGGLINENVYLAEQAPEAINCEGNATFNGYVEKPALEGLTGSGTAEDPFLINNLEELIWFRNDVNTYTQDGSNQYKGKYVKLTADIDLTGINWEPIGKNAQSDHQNFLGHFDGNCKTISNLTIEGTDYLGFFANVGAGGDGTPASVKNLTFNNVKISGTGNYVGGVIANGNATTTVENVHVTGTIDISGGKYIGGIVGHAYVKMNNVSVVGTGTIKSTVWCAGGILGYAGEGATNIMNAHVEGITITSAAGGLGAIVGMAEDNNGTQPISGSNLSAKNVAIKTYTGAYGDAYANYALGYLYGGNPTSKLTGTLTVENVTVETSTGETPTIVDAVASVNGTIYFDLQSAVNAAQAGETVKLIKNVTLTNTLTIHAGKNIILDLNGKTISQSKTCTASYSMIENKGGLTITGNGKISFTDTGAGDPNFGWGSYTIHNSGNLVVENGTIEFKGNQAFATHCSLAIFQYSGSTTINGGSIVNNAYRSVRLWKGDMTINGGDFQGQVWVHCVDNSAKLTIKGGAFAPALNGGDGSSVFVNNSGCTAELTVTGGIFNTKIGANDVEALSGAITGGLFTEAAKNGTNTALLGNNTFSGEVNEDGYYTVAHKAIEVTYADGTVEYFDDMLEAVPYKTDYDKLQGATIKLLADVTGKGIRFMETNMVLDLNGYTYTINNATGSSGTNTSGFQIREEASKTTIKNGTIKVAAPADMVENTSVIWMFNSYSADFTVENVTIDCTNMAWGYGENCYVHVSRSGDNTNFTGTTKVINFNSEVAGNAINVGGTMTIGKDVVPGGAVELDDGATLSAPERLPVTTTLNGCKVVYENGVYKVAHKAIQVTYADGTVEYFDDMLEAVPYKTDYDKLQGATIKLLADVTGKGIRFMETNMVLDLNGYTYTINNATGSSGTNTSGFQIREEASKTTIKNGTIKVAAPADMVENTSVIWMFNSYSADFTVENVTIDCTNMAWGYGENCYVHVSRSGDNTNFTGTTKVINFNSEVAGNAINVGGTMTIGKDVVPGGAVELDDGATLTAPEGLNVTTTVDGYEVKYADGKYALKAEEVGTIKATEATLLYNEIIQMRFIFALTGDAESNGILVFKDKSDADNHEISKAAQNRSLEFKSGKYYGYTDGIPAKEMGDTVYIVGYLKFADGTYAFSQTVPYSPLIYAERMMTKGTEETKALCKALMHYGAAAQTFMNYNTSNLMNANFEEVPFDISVLGNEQFSYQSGNVNGFTIKEANMLFEGAISYRFKYQIDSSLEGKALYMEYVVKGVTKTVELKAIGDFYYGYAADNAAKDMDELIIAKPFYYNENNEKVYGGSITYSGYEYARRMTNSSTATAAGKALAQAFAMYINAANTAIK